MILDETRKNIDESLNCLNDFNYKRHIFCGILYTNISHLRADLNAADLNSDKRLLIDKTITLLKTLANTDFPDHHKFLNSFYDEFYELYTKEKYHNKSQQYVYNSMILLQSYAQQLSDIGNTFGDFKRYLQNFHTDVTDCDYALDSLRNALYICHQQYKTTAKDMRKLINYLSEPIESPPRL